jgi:hypothetical protein
MSEQMRAALVLARGMIAMDREICRDGFTIASKPEVAPDPDEAECLAGYDSVIAAIDAALAPELPMRFVRMREMGHG